MASRNTEINRHTLQNAHPGESIGHGSAGIWRGQSAKSRAICLLCDRGSSACFLAHQHGPTGTEKN